MHDESQPMLKVIGGTFFNLLNRMEHADTKSHFQDYQQVLELKGDNDELVLRPVIDSFDIYWDVVAGKGHISSD